MKPFLLFFTALLPLIGQAQQPAQHEGCTDIVYLRDGSIYRGKVIEQTLEGPLVIQTWSGMTLHLSQKKVRRVIQKCPDTGSARNIAAPKPYSFQERGWFNATQLSYLAGNTWRGGVATGYSLHNITGYAFSRWIGVGLGIGVDTYSPYLHNINQPTYPVFVEARGYFLAKPVTPFYAAGAGWGFAGGGAEDRQGFTENWEGGWLAQLQLGYRMGNNFCMYGGLRFQRQNRDWTNIWDFSYGKDRILHQRFELGFGLLL